MGRRQLMAIVGDVPVGLPALSATSRPASQAPSCTAPMPASPQFFALHMGTARTFARRARTLTVRSHVVCACVLACLLACVCVRACLRVCVRACLRMYGCRQLSMGAVCFVGVVRVCAGPRLLAV